MNISPEIVNFYLDENKDKITKSIKNNMLFKKLREEGFQSTELWVQMDKRKDEMNEYTVTSEELRKEATRILHEDLCDENVEFLGYMVSFYNQPDSIQNLKHFDGIIRYITENTEIDYIQYRDQKYTDCGEEDPCWCSIKHYIEDEDEEVKIKKIQPPSHEIKYHIKMPWEDKRVFFFDKVILKNISGFNRDARGSDNVDIILDFNPTYILKGNKLSDFVEGIYRVKSHKFDTWYELMDKAYCKINGEELTIFLEFNHGS